MAFTGNLKNSFYRSWTQWLLVLTMGALIASCTKNKKEEYGLDIRETLRININTEPPSLDWNKATDTTSSTVTVNIMDGLAQYDLNDPELKLLPALAESWEPSEKAKVWTFKLRKGVKWTDGVEFTAQHVIDGWERLLNSSTASEYAYFLFSVKNAQNYFEKKVKDFGEVGVKATDPYTLVVTLNQPASFFPYLTTHHSTYPIRKDLIQKFGDQWPEAGNMVSLGAYKLKVWEHDKAIVLERNDDYYGGKAKIKNILAYMIVEGSTALNLFETGKLDSQHEIPSVELSKYKERKEIREKPALILQYYGFNTKKAPTNNVLVRKAIAHAIDKSEIVSILGGGQVPLTSWIPVGMMGYEPDIGLKFDVEKAKEYLAKAGYPDGKKLPRLVIGLNTNEDHKRVAENIQGQLKRNLGIDVEIQNEEWKTYLNRLKVDPPNVFRMGWQADYPDPDNFMNLMTSTSENNRTGWKNSGFDKLVNDAVSLTDNSKRKELYSKAQRLLLEEGVAAVPLYSSVRHKLVADRVVNYPINVMDLLVYKYTSLKE